MFAGAGLELFDIVRMDGLRKWTNVTLFDRAARDLRLRVLRAQPSPSAGYARGDGWQANGELPKRNGGASTA